MTRNFDSTTNGSNYQIMLANEQIYQEILSEKKFLPMLEPTSLPLKDYKPLLETIYLRLERKSLKRWKISAYLSRAPMLWLQKFAEIKGVKHSQLSNHIFCKHFMNETYL